MTDIALFEGKTLDIARSFYAGTDEADFFALSDGVHPIRTAKEGGEPTPSRLLFSDTGRTAADLQGLPIEHIRCVELQQPLFAGASEASLNLQAQILKEQRQHQKQMRKQRWIQIAPLIATVLLLMASLGLREVIQTFEVRAAISTQQLNRQNDQKQKALKFEKERE